MNCFALISPKQCSTLIFNFKDNSSSSFCLVWSSIVSSVTSSIFDHCVGCELFGGWWEGDNGFWRQGKTILLLLLTLCPVSTWPTFQQNYIVIITVFVVDNANLLKQKCQLKKKKTVSHHLKAFSKTAMIPTGMHAHHYHPDIILFYVLRQYQE